MAPEPVVEKTASDTVGESHRLQAVEANNSTWELADREDRTPEDDEDMLRRAYAAAYHWDRAAGRVPGNAARADWLLARVNVLVGRPAIALHHAERCLATCTTHGLDDFDLAYAHEAAARALPLLGRETEAGRALARARDVPVADPEDRTALEADLATLSHLTPLSDAADPSGQA